MEQVASGIVPEESPAANGCILGAASPVFGLAWQWPQAANQICPFGLAQLECPEAATGLVQKTHLARLAMSFLLMQCSSVSGKQCYCFPSY